MSTKTRGSEEFYKNEVIKRREAIENLVNEISFCIVGGSYADNSVITNLTRYIKESKVLADMKKKFPKYEPGPTEKQTSAAFSAKKHCYHYSTFIQKAIDEAIGDEDLNDLLDLSDKKIPEKVKYYLLQARKCYFFECWDACIVMIARAIEYSLKEYLLKKKIVIKGFPTLGNLSRNYEKVVDNEDILKYIIEVQKMERNICAHDSEKERQRMTQDEADHSWTAIRIILKEFLGVNITISLLTK